MISTARRDEIDPLLDRVNFVLNQVSQMQFGDYSKRESWSPAINMYRMERCLEVCVDLAGVDRRKLDVRIEPGRLTIRGVRETPEPPEASGRQIQVVSMEIDHGSFGRTVALPKDVDVDRVTSTYRNGLLWINLPCKREG